MASTEVADPEVIQPPRVSREMAAEHKRSIAEIERTASVDEKKDMQNYERVDKELAKYVSDARITISPERNVELRRMIDRRVLVVMICTYFLQAIDKGTLSFASIMGIIPDTGLVGQEVRLLLHRLVE
jgi:hypothetical protein